MAEDTQDTIPSLVQGDTKAPPMAYGETGYTGLVTIGGRVWDECQHELRWPQAYHTFKKMAMDGAVSPSLEYVEGKVAEATWKVSIPKGVSKEQELVLKAQQKYLTEVMNDMRHSWTTMIKNAATYRRYGFSVLEMVLRFRNYKYGSKYDDGLVGVEALSPRSQGTIAYWYWKNKGREIDGFDQRVVVPTDNIIQTNGWEILRTVATEEFNVRYIPMKKCLHFRHNPENDSPTGTSPLVAAWQAWKMKQAYEQSEAVGCAQDNNAFKILYLPPEYLTEDADDDRKASYRMYQRMMEQAHQAKLSGWILPMLTDNDGNKMFDFDIKSISGNKSYDTNAIIARYVREIQVSLFADVLAMGGDGGSYSLSESKMTIIDMAIRATLNEIKDQLNHKLIKTLFEQNGWSLEHTPYYDYELPNSETLDNKSKAYQRMAAVNLIPRNVAVINQCLRDLNVDFQYPEDFPMEELIKEIDPFGTGQTSESGKGMQSGMSNTNGTTTAGSGDASVANGENA